MNEFNWTVADWLQLSYISITVLEVVVTVFVAVWVVQSVQKNLDTEKTLKDYFANEIKALRNEARKLIDSFTASEMNAEDMKRAHYTLQCHINDILAVLNKKYQIDKRYLKAYRSNISTIIENDSNYTASYKSKAKVILSDCNKKALQDLSLKNDHLFTEILLKIYERNN